MPQALPLFIFFGCFPIAGGCRKQLAHASLAGKSRTQPIRASLWNVGLGEVQKERKRKNSFLIGPSLVLDVPPLGFRSFELNIDPGSFKMQILFSSREYI